MSANDLVVVRYPLRFRVVMSMFCVAAAIWLIQPPIETKNLIVAIGAICLNACFLSYRIDVSRSEIRVRRVPFLTRTINATDIVQIVQGTTVVLITRTGKVPLWNLTHQARQGLSELLPQHLPVISAHTGHPDPAITFRKWKRRASYLGGSFVLAAGILALFLKGAPLHEHWGRIGTPLLFLSMFVGWAFIYASATAYNLWSYLRNMQKIDEQAGNRGPGIRRP